MNKKVGGKVGSNINLFSGASYSQEVHTLSTQITELQEQIEQLRAQGDAELEARLAELRSTLSAGGIIPTSLCKIEVNLSQPRQTFTEESIKALALSLQLDGQQQPIILIERLNQKYLLFDGERRYRAATLLNWTVIGAVIIPEPTTLVPKRDRKLHRRVLLTNLHREDLNPLDIASALVKEIVTEYQKLELEAELETEVEVGVVREERVRERSNVAEEISSLSAIDISRSLHTVVCRIERQGKLKELTAMVMAEPSAQSAYLSTIELSPLERVILKTLLSLQLNPASVSVNVLPMLALAPDLKQAIRQRGLGGIQAKSLHQISAKRLGVSAESATLIRLDLTEQVLSSKLSVSQTRTLVKQIVSSYKTSPLLGPSPSPSPSCTPQPNHVASPRRLGTRVVKVLSDISPQQLATADLLSIRDALQSKLAEIQSFLGN